MRRLCMTVCLCVLVPAAAAGAATVVSGTFAGQTSQSQPFSLKIVNGRVTKGTLGWTASCQQPSTTMRGTTAFTGHLTDHSYAVHNHSYTSRINYPGNAPGGYKNVQVSSAHFTVHQHKLRGTFSLTGTIYTSRSHQRITSCQTGRISFGAAAG
jgi:hypothetical protein